MTHFLRLVGVWLGLLLLAHAAQAQAPAWQTAQPLPVDSYRMDLQTMAADSSGNLFVVGTFEDTLRLGPACLVSAGAGDVFLAKYCPATQRFVWAERLGGPANDYVSNVAVVGHRVYVAGGLRPGRASFGHHRPIVKPDPDDYVPKDTDTFVAKFQDEGPTGRFEWVWQVASGGESGATALAAVGHRVYLAGFCNPFYVPFPLAQPHRATGLPAATMFVARLTDVGRSASFDWAQPLYDHGNSHFEQSYPAALAVSGSSVYVTGQFGADSLQVGTTFLANPDPRSSRLFLAKLTDHGARSSVGWGLQASGNGDAIGLALAAQGTSVYLAGNFNSDTLTLGATTLVYTPPRPVAGDIFVARLTDEGAQGRCNWVQAAGGPGYDQVRGLSQQGSSLYVVGRSTGPAATFGTQRLTNYTVANRSVSGSLSGAAGDIFLAKLTDAGSTGFFEWATRTGGGGRGGAAAVAVAAGRVYVAGDLLADSTLFGAALITYNPSFCWYLASLPDPALATLAPVVPTAAATASALVLTWPAGQPATYTLLDGVGRVVRRRVAVAGTAVEMDTAGLAAGLYALRVQAAGRQVVRRVVVR